MVEQAANMPRFSVQPTTLKQGWTLIHNDSSAPRQAFMVPIKQGTTVQEVITSLNGVSTFTGISVGVDMISPHSSINWMLQAPRDTTRWCASSLIRPRANRSIRWEW